ncbi:MAG: peptidylprolyl isomerase [Pseudonocardiaceae bacterium]
MPTNEQRREAAKRKLDRQLARRAERAKARRRNAVVASVSTVVLVVGIGVLIVTLSRGSGNTANTAATPSTPAAPADTAPATPSLDTKLADPPVRPNPLPASVDCQYPAAQEVPARPVQPPLAGGTDAKGTVPATMQTSVGAIGLTLDRALAPCTVNSFLSLAKQGFYANTPCHRLVTSPSLHVLQCGDPTGSGTGGPGYTIPDEVFPELTYGRGYIAMANTGAPNSGGSQFFLVYGQTRLPPSYTVFGAISVEGLTVIDQVARAGDDGSRQPGDGKPNQPVMITSVEAPAA